MDLARRLTRRVELTVAGKRWPILFTHGVLLDIEELTGLPIMQTGLDLCRPSAQVLRAVVWAALRQAGAGYSLVETGELIRLGKMAEIRLAVIEAWRASMPEPEPTPEGGANPRARAPHVHTSLEAWAIARQDLGLTDAEWLAMTPRMLHALSRQRLERIRQWEYMISKSIAMTCNFSFGAPKRPFRLDDFMSHPWPGKSDEEELQTGEDVLRAFAPFMDTSSKQVVNALLKTEN